MAITCPTPHIAAEFGAFANTVLMPGDPLRAKLIAEDFLENAVLVNNVRGVQGYTGTYKGIRVSVMASGMGMPSIGIYSHELYTAYDVKTILRVGSAGALLPDLPLGALVIGQGACTDSNWQTQFRLPGSFAPIADYMTLETCVQVCRDMSCHPYVGNLLSSNFFYTDDGDLPDSEKINNRWANMGVMAVEMEAAALYMNAARLGKRALAICTVSDQLVTGQRLSSLERQTGFGQMIQVALETAVGLESV